MNLNSRVTTDYRNVLTLYCAIVSEIIDRMPEIKSELKEKLALSNCSVNLPADLDLGSFSVDSFAFRS